MSKQGELRCPRCGDALTIGRQHRCDDPWVFTAPCSTAPSGKRAVRIEYITHGFFATPPPVDVGPAPVTAVLGQPPFGTDHE